MAHQANSPLVRKSALILLTFSALAYAQSSYVDNFEAPSFNQFWTMSGTGGTVVLCGDRNHTTGGKQSVCFQEVPNYPISVSLSLSHQFTNPIQGNFSVWYYDFSPAMNGGGYVNGLLLRSSSTRTRAYVGTGFPGQSATEPM
jgi:hypothetical protein